MYQSAFVLPFSSKGDSEAYSDVAVVVDVVAAAAAVVVVAAVVTADFDVVFGIIGSLFTGLTTNVVAKLVIILLLLLPSTDFVEWSSEVKILY